MMGEPYAQEHQQQSRDNEICHERLYRKEQYLIYGNCAYRGFADGHLKVVEIQLINDIERTAENDDGDHHQHEQQPYKL